MRVRIRFEKTGPIRFVGHLDFMRTFQKIIKKSGLDAVYTTGFNPHIVLSFADPLGVGEESTGEYADVEFAWKDTAPMSGQELYRLTDIGLDNDALPLPPSPGEVTEALNRCAPGGVRFTGAVRVGLIRSSKAMALVRYASWKIVLSDDLLAGKNLEDCVSSFMDQESIIIHKVTKKSEGDIDIRPLIRSLEAASPEEFPSFVSDPAFQGKRCLNLTCAAGSFRNLKPDAVVTSLCRLYGEEADSASYRLIRTELYDEEMRSLLACGTAF